MQQNSPSPAVMMASTSFYKRTITIARIYDIPIRIDFRWFVVFVFSTWLVANNLHTIPIQFPGFLFPPVHIFKAWTIGLVTTVGLFLSVLGHELAHANVVPQDQIIEERAGGDAESPHRQRDPNPPRRAGLELHPGRRPMDIQPFLRDR